MKLFGTYTAPEIVVDGATLALTSAALSRGAQLSGLANGKQGTFSCWFRMDGGDGTVMYALNLGNSLGGGATTVALRKQGSSLWEILCRDASLNNLLLIDTVNAYVASSPWHHLLASWDLTLGAPGVHLYVDDVSDKSVTTDANTANIAYTSTADAILFNQQTGGATTQLNAALAEFYFTTSYMDMSIVANRRRFISSRKKPVSLGPDGRLPTGAVPIMYHHLADGETAANFATNRGSGGNFTASGGALATASTSPSD